MDYGGKVSVKWPLLLRRALDARQYTRNTA